MEAAIQRIFDLDNAPLYKLKEEGSLVTIAFPRKECRNIHLDMLTELSELFRSSNIEVTSIDGGLTWCIEIREG